MLGRGIKFLGGIFWVSLVVVVLFGLGIWALGKLKGVPIVGPVAGAIQNFGDANG